jgi:hypothetical protein
MSLDVMSSTRQVGDRMRVESFVALVAEVTAAPSDRSRLIERAVGAAVHLNEKSKDTYRGQCRRVTDSRVTPVFTDALGFSRRVIAERMARDPKLPTVQHVLLDVCKRIAAKSRKSPGQVMSDLESAYNTFGAYPPD